MNRDLIHYDIEQGIPEWKELRRGTITGSKYKDARDRLKSGGLSGKAKLYAMNVARERCRGKAPDIFETNAMREGRVQEGIARAAYERRTGALVEPVGFFKTTDNLFGLSPDGLIDDDGVLEIKTMVSSDTMFTAMVERDVSEYIDQCLGYLWLLGRKWVDLVLWAEDLEDLGMQMVVIRIERDEAAIEKLEADLMAFVAIVREYESKLRKAAKAAQEQVNNTKEVA